MFSITHAVIFDGPFSVHQCQESPTPSMSDRIGAPSPTWRPSHVYRRRIWR